MDEPTKLECISTEDLLDELCERYKKVNKRIDNSWLREYQFIYLVTYYTKPDSGGNKVTSISFTKPCFHDKMYNISVEEHKIDSKLNLELNLVALGKNYIKVTDHDDEIKKLQNRIAELENKNRSQYCKLEFYQKPRIFWKYYNK